MIKPLCLGALALLASLPYPSPAAERPLFRDFVGLCGHTVQFKPDLYQPVCRLVRDYHPVKWDLGEDTSVMPDWPFAKNRVSWEKVYGSWKEKGLGISVCLQFDEIKAEEWKDLERDARAYGKGFAENFGPGGKYPFVDWVELGNEPGLLDDATYLRIFQAMTAGLREGNPKLKIATCNTEVGPSDRYWKGVDIFTPHLGQIDALRIHRYAIKDGWPTWRRSYPEDASVPIWAAFKKCWTGATKTPPGKKCGWVSSAGIAARKSPTPKDPWASFSPAPMRSKPCGWCAATCSSPKWVWTRLFLFFFNDEDEPSFHACSGITRHFQPKPGYHAIAWMLKHLADYRFARAILKSEQDGYLFEFTPEKTGAPKVLAAWHATREGVSLPLDLPGAAVTRAEQMPLDAQAPGEAEVKPGDTTVKAGPRPILLWVK